MKVHKNRKKVNLVEFGSEKHSKKMCCFLACKGLKPYPGKCPCCGETRIPGHICPHCGNKYFDYQEEMDR